MSRTAGFAPGVQAAGRASVPGLARRLLLSLGAGRRVAPQLHIERFEAAGIKFRKGSGKTAARRDVMGHVLPHLLAARLAGIGGHQADRVHLGCPFLVVVTGAGRLAKMVLPEMHHLMHQGGQALLGGTVAEVRRIEGNLIGDDGAVSEAEPPAREIAVARLGPLHGDKAGRQLAGKQPLVEEGKSPVQAVIGLLMGLIDAIVVAFCIVRYIILNVDVTDFHPLVFAREPGCGGGEPPPAKTSHH